MLIVQRYHSIHEIDPEFIPSIELLLKEDAPLYESLVRQHDNAPSTDVFTYFLFFGPTQNTPVGLAQLCLRTIPSSQYLPWWRKLMFWKKDHLHWKEAIWKVTDGSSGLFVFDSRFARSGKEKFQSILAEYNSRPEIMAQVHYHVKGLQDFKSDSPERVIFAHDLTSLEPLPKAFKAYPDYLASLARDIQLEIKNKWKELHQSEKINLGDYPSIWSVQKSTPISDQQKNDWEKARAQILTFEKNDEVLGLIVVITGKDGNVFFEPFPFESGLIGDELYTQYALLKFFEMPEARRCHMIKNGERMLSEDKEDLSFFQAQGFTTKSVIKTFSSRLNGMDKPV